MTHVCKMHICYLEMVLLFNSVCVPVMYQDEIEVNSCMYKDRQIDRGRLISWSQYYSNFIVQDSCKSYIINSS